MTIKTPLTYGDAWELAAGAVHGEPVQRECYCAICSDVRDALMAVDVASREQARADIVSGISPARGDR